MRRLLAAAGAVLVLLGVVLTVAGTGINALALSEAAIEDLVTVLVLTGAAVAIWKIAGSVSADDGDVAIPPWAPGGAIVYGDPERTPTDYPLSAEELSEVVAAAGATARQQGTVEDGLAVLRSPLREALVDALRQGGMDRDSIEDAIESGEWTENDWAAYVIEPSVGAPRWTIKQRFRAWLFPEDTVQRLARIAVHGVARAADDAIPPVPGQSAPRTVPVAEPSIADLQRGADGDLQEAIEPTAVARGPAPPTEHHGLDEGVEEKDESQEGDSEEVPADDESEGSPAPESTPAGLADDEEVLGR